MLINPIITIARFGIRQTLRVLGLNTSYTHLFTALYNVTRVLSRTVGILPTLTVVWNLRRYITFDFTSVRTILTSNPRLNQHVVQTILNTIQPYWCTTNKEMFKRLFKFYIFWFSFLPFGLFRPIFMFFVRLSGGVIASSIGILWNDTLSNIGYLKSYALLVTDFLSSYFDFNIPTISNSDVKDLTKEGYTFSILGIIFLGFAGIVASICITDYFFPDLLNNVPVVNKVPSYTYSVYHSIIDWFSSLGSSPDNGKSPDLNPMSRTNSDGSVSTVRPDSGLKDIWLNDDRHPWRDRLDRANHLADLKAGGEASTSAAQHIIPEDSESILNNWS